MAVRVVLWSAVSRELTGGEREFEVEAHNVRGVIRAMEARFPGLGEVLTDDSTISINGELYESAIFQTVADGAEVYFLPKLEAG